MLAWAQDTAALGRSHRSKLGKERLQKCINDSARILGLPEDYMLGIVSPPRQVSHRESKVWQPKFGSQSSATVGAQ
jgi:phosphoserine aminotransferase